MSHFGELPDVVGGYLTKNLRKCQKSPFLGAKCTNLVTLAETRFQCYQMTALPDMNIFCQILVIFGFFLNFLRNFWQTTSGSSPKCDILEGWQKHVCLKRWLKFNDDALEGLSFLKKERRKNLDLESNSWNLFKRLKKDGLR